MTKLSKNILVLTLCQAIFNSSSSILALTSGLVGFQLLDGNIAFATVPVSAMVLGTAISSAPAALIMSRVGRRSGFTYGALIGLLGAIFAAAGIGYQSFWIFTLGIFLLGMYNGFSHHYRFAAADLADDSFRGKAISLVLAGGVVAAFLGPEVGTKTANVFSEIQFMGTYFVVILMLIISVCLVQFISIPKPSKENIKGKSRSLLDLISQRRFVLAVLSSMIGFAVMVLVMTATPIAMIERCGHTLEETKFVIQWHVVAMFAPSFITGSLISRYGVFKIIGIGIFFISLAVVFALSGISLTNFWLALFFLGFGWNFMFVGGSTLLTETYKSSEQGKAQAFHDFAVFYLVAIASVSSGILLQFYGWKGVGYGTIPFLILVSLVFFWTIFKNPSNSLK